MELVHFTDRGTYRKSNQDACCVRVAATGCGPVAMVVVCDGMGGLAQGEVASNLVAHNFAQWFDQVLGDTPAEPPTTAQVYTQWSRVLEFCHNWLLDYAARHEGKRMGTTVSALLLTAQEYCLMQVGDSRIYLSSQDKTAQLTEDQTWAMREYRAGRLTAEEYAVDPRRNVLLQCVGDGRMTPVFQEGHTPARGACLVCSDGFYHFNGLEEVTRALRVPGGQEAMRRALLDMAVNARRLGETDNMTLAALRWDPFYVSHAATQSLNPAADGVPDDDHGILVSINHYNTDCLREGV